MTRLISGNTADAMGPLERGLRLSTYDPQNLIWFGMLALTFLDGLRKAGLPE